MRPSTSGHRLIGSTKPRSGGEENKFIEGSSEIHPSSYRDWRSSASRWSPVGSRIPPDSKEAFRLAALIDERWIEAAESQSGFVDGRPWFVRSYWRKRNARAALPNRQPFTARTVPCSHRLTGVEMGEFDLEMSTSRRHDKLRIRD